MASASDRTAAFVTFLVGAGDCACLHDPIVRWAKLELGAIKFVEVIDFKSL